MDKDRIVAGLDVHKDTIYLCVMDNTEAVIFAKVYGTLTPDLELMCSDMVSHGVTEAAMEKHFDLLGPCVECLVREHVSQIGKSLFYKAASRSQE